MISKRGLRAAFYVVGFGAVSADALYCSHMPVRKVLYDLEQRH